MHAVSDELDPFWHAHILFTKKYRLFCEEAIGCMMDHNPLDHKFENKVDAVNELYQYTLKHLPLFFSYVNPMFYPATTDNSRMMCTHYDHISASYQYLDNAILPRATELTCVHELFANCGI